MNYLLSQSKSNLLVGSQILVHTFLRAADDPIEVSENGAQVLYMPQTPALDATTVSPLSPGTQFPITPTSNIGDTSGDSAGKHGIGKDSSLSYNHSRPEREIDPTTLFVGGLEMFGPGAWDEKKVENFFSRFGGLESVKVVRPGMPSVNSFVFFEVLLNISLQSIHVQPLLSSNSITLILRREPSRKRYVCLHPVERR